MPLAPRPWAAESPGRYEFTHLPAAFRFVAPTGGRPLGLRQRNWRRFVTVGPERCQPAPDRPRDPGRDRERGVTSRDWTTGRNRHRTDGADRPEVRGG